jgi:hypothetical protein
MAAPLTSDEIDACRGAFAAFANAHGRVEVWHLRAVLESVGGHKPTEEELFSMVAEIDEGMAGELDFDAFLRVIELQKRRVAAQNEDDSDLSASLSAGCARCAVLPRRSRREVRVPPPRPPDAAQPPTPTPCRARSRRVRRVRRQRRHERRRGARDARAHHQGGLWAHDRH